MTALVAESDLHGLVDGRIEPGRRAGVLRRLAGSPADRATIETWQAQADLLRQAFRDVADEPLPAALDVAPACQHGGGAERPLRGTAPNASAARQGGGTAITAALLIAIGLTFAWMAGSRDDGARGGGGATAVATDVGTAPPPAFRLPDLMALGLRLTDVEPDADEPSALVFHFRDGGTGRATLRVARNAPDIGRTPLEHDGTNFTWRSPTAVFTLDGTVPSTRLRAVALALQSDQGGD